MTLTCNQHLNSTLNIYCLQNPTRDESDLSNIETTSPIMMIIVFFSCLQWKIKNIGYSYLYNTA